MTALPSTLVGHYSALPVACYRGQPPYSAMSSSSSEITPCLRPSYRRDFAYYIISSSRKFIFRDEFSGFKNRDFAYLILFFLATCSLLLIHCHFIFLLQKVNFCCKVLTFFMLSCIYAPLFDEFNRVFRQYSLFLKGKHGFLSVVLYVSFPKTTVQQEMKGENR